MSGPDMGVAGMKDACVWETSGPSNYRPLQVYAARARTVHLVVAGMGLGNGTVLADSSLPA